MPCGAFGRARYFLPTGRAPGGDLPAAVVDPTAFPTSAIPTCRGRFDARFSRARRHHRPHRARSAIVHVPTLASSPPLHPGDRPETCGGMSPVPRGCRLSSLASRSLPLCAAPRRALRPAGTLAVAPSAAPRGFPSSSRPARQSRGLRSADQRAASVTPPFCPGRCALQPVRPHLPCCIPVQLGDHVAVRLRNMSTRLLADVQGGFCSRRHRIKLASSAHPLQVDITARGADRAHSARVRAEGPSPPRQRHHGLRTHRRVTIAVGNQRLYGRRTSSGFDGGGKPRNARS